MVLGRRAADALSEVLGARGVGEQSVVADVVEALGPEVDEKAADANLDQDGDDALARTLQRLSQRKVTTVVITHRIWILRHVDKILLLRNGNVDMVGPRDEILSKIARPEPAPMRQTVPESSHG